MELIQINDAVAVRAMIELANRRIVMPVKKSTSKVVAARKPTAPVAPRTPKAAEKRVGAKPQAERSRTRTTKALVRNPASANGAKWMDTLRDGTHVLVRPIRKSDMALERRFIERLSPQARRMRFLGQIAVPSDALLRQLTDIDFVHDVAFIALVHRDGEKQEIGVSRYSVGPDGKTCECAVTVSDAWHNKGLATILMRHLITVARDNGMRTLISYDAADNLAMRDLANHLGFRRAADPDDAHQVIHRLDL